MANESLQIVSDAESSSTSNASNHDLRAKLANQSSKDVDDPSTNIATLTGVKLYSILGALVLVVLMVSLDSLIMATAIPRITDDFHTIKDIGWYVTAYMICNSALQPLTGKVFTYFNLTYSYLAFIALFEVGSIICATAPSSAALVIGRAVAGMGGSGLSNGALTIVGITAPPEQRPVLLGALMAVMGLGQIIAPIIGGALSQYATWRWCFWINLPIGAVTAATIIAIRVINPNRGHGLTMTTFIQKFDIVGFFMFAPACVMVLLALQWGGSEYSWNSATIIGLFCGFGISAIGFIYWEWRHGEDAMFPGSLMKQRVVYSSCISATFQSGAMFISGYYISLWFQAIKRDSPIMSAIATLPTFATQILGVVISSALINRIGFFTPFAIIGSALTAIGTGLMCTFNADTSIGEWVGFQLIQGLGRGFSWQQPVNAIQAGLSGAQMSTGMAIIAWAQFFGGALFMAFAQTSFTSLLRTAVREFVPNIDPQLVINAGATNYITLARGAATQALLTAYNQAIVRTFYLPTAAAAVATCTAYGMGWKRVFKAKSKPTPEEKMATSA